MQKILEIIVILLLIFTILHMSSIAEKNPINTIYVDDDNTEGPWDGSMEHPYRDIQSGIDAASDSDTIYVYSGVYYELIKVNKSITIQGEDKTSTIIDGGRSWDVVSIIADNVNLHGFTIQNSGQNHCAGIDIESAEYCVIANNIIKVNKYGMDIRDSRNIKIIGNVVSHNYHGITVVKSQNVVIEDNIIADNSYTGIGIYHTFTEKNEILNNIIINNVKGIYVWNCLSGLTMIENNEISNNENGIEISSRSCIIFRNNICENKEYGIKIQVSKENLIYANNFKQNGVHTFFEYFREKGFNKWYLAGEGNYWDDWDGSGPKIIRGELILFVRGPDIGIPWFNIDWYPAREPYII